jgi:hypothetical protein
VQQVLRDQVKRQVRLPSAVINAALHQFLNPSAAKQACRAGGCGIVVRNLKACKTIRFLALFAVKNVPDKSVVFGLEGPQFRLGLPLGHRP